MHIEKFKKVKVVFYLNFEDKKFLKEKCELLQITPSFFIRNAVLENLGKPIYSKPIRDLDTKKILLSLTGTANNLNQIAKQLNSGHKFLLADQQTLLEEIVTLRENIKEIYSKI